MMHARSARFPRLWLIAPCRPGPPQLRRCVPHGRAAKRLATLTGAASAGLAAGAPAVGGPPPGERLLVQDPTYTPPAALPPAPTSARLMDVLPYLLRLALGEPQLYWRLGAALALLLASKAAGLLAPVYFKHAVDALSSSAPAATAAGGSGAAAAAAAAAETAAASHAGLAAGAAGMALLLSGACRALSGMAKELQHPCFTPVAQAAGRRVSHYTFLHVLGLDLTYHLSRRTGGLKGGGGWGWDRCHNSGDAQARGCPNLAD